METTCGGFRKVETRVYTGGTNLGDALRIVSGNHRDGVL